MPQASNSECIAIALTHMSGAVALVTLAEHRIELIVLALGFWAAAYICGRKSER